MWWLDTVAMFAIALGVTAVLNWAALRPFRRVAAAHWSERARLLWPVRRGAAIAGVAVPLAVWRVMFRTGHATVMEVVVSLLAVFAGGLLAGFVVHHAAFPQRRLREWISLMLCLIVLRYGPFFAWLFTGISSAFDMAAARPWLGVAIFMQLFVSSGAWLWLLRGLGLMHRGAPELEAMVRELAERLGVSVKHVWETAPVAANAVASPLWRAVVVSRETIEVLAPEELRSILAHELGHLGEPRRVTVLRALGGCWSAPLGALGWAVHGWGFAGVALVLATMVIWLRWTLRLSRSEEHRVDAVAREAVGSGEVAARALEKLHAAGSIPATLPTAQMTHPSLFDRMLAAGVTPDFERPAVPKRWGVNGWASLAVWVAANLMNFRHH